MLKIRILLCLLVPVFFMASVGSGATLVSGAQCRSHLEPLTLLLKRHYAKFYYEVNDEITNVLGVPLNDIAKYEAETQSAQIIVNLTRATIKGCSSSCGSLFNCKKLASSNILKLNLGVKAIDPEKIASISDDVKPTYPVPESPITNDSKKQKVFSNLYPTLEECIGDEDSELCKHYDWSLTAEIEPKEEPNTKNEDISCIFDESCMGGLNREEVVDEPKVFEDIAPITAPITSEI